ncbi:MAG: hypothetical protein JRN20_02330 [Nitrososphaerota archaeon]|nr:hypothetical protein [Nitrososphaerota archaeon]MDG6924197.1 hypothetical protein [Nitrososphaerota archaeon]
MVRSYVIELLMKFARFWQFFFIGLFVYIGLERAMVRGFVIGSIVAFLLTVVLVIIVGGFMAGTGGQ